MAIVRGDIIAGLERGRLSTHPVLVLRIAPAQLQVHTLRTENMYAYTSSVFWCTPEGSVGFRHCDSRFAMTVLCGMSEASAGRA